MDGRIFLPSIVGGRNVSPRGDPIDPGPVVTDPAVTDPAVTDPVDVEPPFTPSRDSCYVSLQLGPGESCTYPGTDDGFTINVRGRGRFLTYLRGIRIDVDNETIDGQVYDFRASHQGDGVWLIERVAGNTEPPTADDSDGDGIPNVSDSDDDNDGTPDLDDPCPLDATDTCDDAPDIASLEVYGAVPMTAVGETIQLVASAHMSDGSSQVITRSLVHWISADPAVATVKYGSVTAVGGGNARIVASYRGHKAVVEVSVHISSGETETVRMMYATPSDRAFRSDYRDAIRHAVVDLQSWYRRQTGGLTFSLHDSTPEQCQLSETSDYYDQDPWNKVFKGVQRCAPVQRNTTTHAWVIYADLDESCDQRGPLGRGGPGLTILHSGGLEGLIGNRLMYYSACGRGPWPGPVTRFIGGLGHELGHALGLSHPPGCNDGLPSCDRDALMHLGYTIYPNTHLRPADKHALWRSPFIDVNPALRQLMEGSGNAPAIRGTVTDPGGTGVAGMRIAAVAEDFWAWAETASGGSFEIRLPEGSSGSSALSLHAGGTADCGWLGYHGDGRLTTIREHAASIEVGERDPSDVEINLAVMPGRLCQGQRTISGTVRGPEDDPVGVWVRAFGQWSFSGDGGLFELRLPEGAVGRSPLFINTSECRHVGFYGPGGFTTRLAEAWQVEYGGVDLTGVEIRLPATSQELCDRQPTIAGTVMGPGGDPIEGVVVEAQPFSRRGTSGANGSFVVRLLEGSAGTSVLAIHADCGRVGYYGPDGFTTSRADATGVEVVAGNANGIEIRLPLEVGELCAE